MRRDAILADLRPAPPLAAISSCLAATQGDLALHRSIDVEDSGQPEAEIAAGRNATRRRRVNARLMKRRLGRRKETPAWTSRPNPR
jgi:hypothetical protein